MKSYDIESRLRQIVFQKTREYLASGKKMNALATKAGIGSGTISRLAYGETKFPRFHTVVAVCDALGVKLTIEDTTSLGVMGSPEWIENARREGALIPKGRETGRLEYHGTATGRVRSKL